MIRYFARSGPPEAMNCPALVCDACGEQIAGEGLVAWGEHPEQVTEMYHVHKGRCWYALKAWFDKRYTLDAGWLLYSDHLTDFLNQLAHNLERAFTEDAEGTYRRKPVADRDKAA